MSNNRFNCCEPVDSNCAVMIIRKKELGKYPVFGTPGIKIWSSEISGYTGTNKDGHFVYPDGTTGCTFTTKGGENPGIYLKNFGIPPENVIHTSDFITQIPGDDIYHLGFTFDPQPKDIKVMVYGTLVLPKRFKGIPFESNGLTGGNAVYSYVKGEIPDSIKQFIQFMDAERAIPNKCFKDFTRHISEVTPIYSPDPKNPSFEIVPFEVTYIDHDISKFMDTPRSDQFKILYSLDGEAPIPKGLYRSDKDDGCAPCKTPYGCYTRGPQECGGIPYAAFQTVPETVNILSIALQICTDENGKKYLTISDTDLISSFNVIKAMITSDANIPDGRDACNLDPNVPVGLCDVYHGSPPIPMYGGNQNPLEAFGKGYSVIKPEICNHYFLYPCDGYCDDTPCDILCTNTDYIIENVIKTSIYELDACGTSPGPCCSQTSDQVKSIQISVTKADDFVPYPLCGEVYDYSGPGLVSYESYECTHSHITVTPCEKSPKITILRKWLQWGNNCSGQGYNDDLSYNEIYDLPPGRCRGGRSTTRCPEKLTECCCGEYGDPPCPQPDSNDPIGDVYIVKEEDGTKYEPNPYLMYTGNPKYFDGPTKPNYSKYVQHFFSVYMEHAARLNPSGYKPYFFNHPSCFYQDNSGLLDWFFYNENLPQRGMGEAIYDPDLGVIRYSSLPNPISPDADNFIVPTTCRITRNGYGQCMIGKEHKLDFKQKSFELACTNSYDTDACWKTLSSYYEMKEIKAFGKCPPSSEQPEPQGMTLTIQMPVGLTLTACTNLLSYKELTRAPKTKLKN